MKTSTNRTLLSSSILATFVAVLLFIAAPTTLLAQQQDADEPKSLKEHLKKKQQELREKAGLEDLNQQAPLRQSDIDLGSLAGPYATFEKDQSWMFGNPGGSFNTPLNRSGQWAGDINDDGTIDFVVRGEPDGPESIVYYGGNTTTSPDQVLNEWLSPVGDVNNDGHADAVTGDGQIYFGSDNGYERSGSSIPQTGLTNGDFSGTNGILIPAGDLNGDGVDDVILKRPDYSATPVMVVYWGSENGNALQSVEQFEINAPDYNRQQLGTYTANTGDFDGDNQQEIYTFGRDLQKDTSYVRILDFDANNEIQVAQDFDVGINARMAESQYALKVMDLNNDGFDEIFIRPVSQFADSPNYVLLEDENNAGEYDPNPVNVYNGMAWPVGDLDDDGYIDFHLGDPDNDNAPHIGYGSGTISEGFLTLDDHVALASTENWRYYYSVEFPYLDTGDINGDGIDDYTLGFLSDDNSQLGRAFVYGNTSGAPTTDKALLDRSEQLDYFNGTTNIGDVNGDGIDDFAINRTSSRTIEVFYGGSSISDQPDLTIDADYSFEAESGGTLETTALGMASGDFNGDGLSDIAVSDSYGVFVHIYFGGESMDGEPDHIIKGSEFSAASSNSAFYFVQDIGDVNDDGIDDFLLGSQLATNENDENLNEAYLFLGDDSSLPNSPDQVISLADPGNYIDGAWKAANIGDYNGDGINDFAVSSPQYQNPSTDNIGKVDVFYGNSSGDFSTPDMTLTPSGNDRVYGYGFSLTGGDFNGDGAGDIAIGRQIVYPENTSADQGESNIDVYLGGENGDAEVDNHLIIDPETVGINNSFLQSFTGSLETINDHDGNGADEIIVLDVGVANAVVFGGNLNMPDSQTLVLRGHTSRSTLGNTYSNAVGDFTGNENTDVIAQQSSRESNFISVAHRYGMPEPIGIASAEDVPDDQGGWVRVTADGYYLDALDADIVGFDHWAVWRKAKDSDKWVNLATVPAYGESEDYVDVHVPNTKIEGSEADSTTYKFKITAQSSSENNLAVSEVDSGFALDNISPDAVSGVTAERNTDEVQLSWNASSANDLNEYEIVSADNPDEPMVTTYQNSATLADSEFDGIKQVSVKARDIHENVSEESRNALAIFETDLGYEVDPQWNLIGIPLDADQEQISSFLSNVESGKLYEYNGSYDQVSEDEVTPGKGYWAKFSSDENYSINGLPLAEVTLELNEGWNLISGTGEAIDTDQFQDPDEVIIDGTLTAFDGGYQESQSLTPSAGYWIRASQEGSVTLSLKKSSAKTAEKETGPTLAEVKEELNKVTVNSSKGYETTLYFGQSLPDQVNPKSFSVPPVAPGEVFDVRFGGTDMRYMQDDSFTIDLQKQETSSNISLNLDLRPTYNHQSYVVQERKGDKVLAEYEVNAENGFTLKNSEVTSLNFTPSGMNNMAQDKPDNFQLDPSYPNPFNPSTTIQYQLPEQVQVTVEVYNMIGRKVSTLVADDQQEAGTHTVRFNASNLSSGVYFVHLRAGSFEQVQKITLIK